MSIGKSAPDQARHTTPVQLGPSGPRLTELGLGTAPLGGLYRAVAEGDARAVVARALELGIGWYDTAPFYGAGTAERRLGVGLGGRTSPVTVSTKVGRVLASDRPRSPSMFVDNGPGEPVFDFSVDGVLRSIDASLSRLGLDSVDILFIHDAEDHESEALESAYPALARLREEGVVSAIGIAMDFPELPARFIRETDIDVVLIAGRYSLLDQSAARDLLPAANERQVPVVVGGVFNSGILADPGPNATFEYTPASAEQITRAHALEAFLSQFEVSLQAAALQFPLRHPAVKAVLTGVRTVQELDRNVADFDREIPEECWVALEESGLLSDHYETHDSTPGAL